MQQNAKALVHRWFDEVWNQGREDTIDELFSDGVAYGLGESDVTVNGPSEFKVFFPHYAIDVSGPPNQHRRFRGGRRQMRSSRRFGRYTQRSWIWRSADRSKDPRGGNRDHPCCRRKARCRLEHMGSTGASAPNRRAAGAIRRRSFPGERGIAGDLCPRKGHQRNEVMIIGGL
jgi:hypothetical protein